MALHWDISNVENHREKCYKEDNSLKDKTWELLWLTMIVHIGHITKENYIEFWLRLKVWETLSPGGFHLEGWTLQDIRDHIGLRTNVHTSKRNWNKALNRHFKETITWFNRKEEKRENSHT